MRAPTEKEKFVMRNALEGLQEDIKCICTTDRSVELYDVLGTMKVNLDVLLSIRNRMKEEDK